MLVRRSARVEFVGLARALEYEVSSPLPARLGELTVELLEPVEPGQQVAWLDSAGLDARLETVKAGVQALRAELESARQQLTSAASAAHEERLAERRRFADDEQGFELEQLELGVALAVDRIEEQRLSLRLTRVQALLAHGVAAPEELDDVRLAHAGVVERVRQNELLLDGVSAALLGARRRTAEFATLASAQPPELQVFIERIRVEELHLREIEVERQALILRAPARGVVQRVCAAPGQALTPGEAVVVVVATFTREVIAYLPEDSDLGIREGERALVSLVRPPWTVSECLVVRVGHALELLPERLWKDATRPEYGLPVVARGALAPILLPGERVGLRFYD